MKSIRARTEVPCRRDLTHRRGHGTTRAPHVLARRAGRRANTKEDIIVQWYREQSKKKQAGVGCLTILVGLWLLGAIFGSGDDGQPVADAPAPAADAPVADAPASTEEPAATEAPGTEVPPTSAPGIGVSVDVGDHAWMVHAAEDKGQTIASGNQFVPDLQTTGKFLVITAGVLNNGDDSFYITAPKVIDDRDREFENKGDAFMLIDEAHRCLLEEVNPGLQKDCAWIYEVPADAAGLKLRVAGSLFDSPVDIDLGQ